MVQKPRSRGANTRRARHSCAPGARLSKSPDSLCGSTRRGAAVTGRNSNRLRIGNSNAIFLTVAGLVSTLLDPDAAPALELAALYHRRWQVEEVFDELKTHLLKSRRVLRSKTAELVRQEFCGWVLANYAVRWLLHEGATRHRIPHAELSFAAHVQLMRRQQAPSGAFPPSAAQTATPPLRARAARRRMREGIAHEGAA